MIKPGTQGLRCSNLQSGSQVIHHIYMKSNFINIYFSNFLLKWLGLTF